jgi:hypothetical protein
VLGNGVKVEQHLSIADLAPIESIKLFDHVPEGRTRLAADPLNMRTGVS